MQSRSPILLSQKTCGVPVFSNHHVHAQATCHQQRFVSKLSRRARRVNDSNATDTTAITTREDVEGNASLFQQFANQDRERRFAGASYADVADAHHWPTKFEALKSSRIIETIARAHS